MQNHNTRTYKLNYLIIMPRLVRNIGDGYSFPLGIAYIASALKSWNFNTFTLNLNHIKGDIFDILSIHIKQNDINVILTGGLSFQYASIKQVLSTSKKINNKLTTICGGGIITSDPETAMNALKYVDYGIIGEGERTVCELADRLEYKVVPKDVNGLIFKHGDRYITTQPRDEIQNLDKIPWPDYEGFDFDKYLQVSPSISGINNKNTVFMISSRSCPYNCTFCFHTTGRKYRQRSLDDFFNELSWLISKYNISYICLADELFSTNLDRVYDFCDRIKPLNIKWWAQFRVDVVSNFPEMLDILKDAGCATMSFGIESADNKILKSMRKNITIEQTEKALELAYSAGIPTEGAFIFGDIEETWETAMRTFNWWRDHLQYKINLNFITTYPGSYLYKWALSKGIIKDKVKFLQDGCPQVNVSKLSDNEYGLLVKKVMEANALLAPKADIINYKILNNKTGRLSINAICAQCRKIYSMTDFKIFSSSFIMCNLCGQRYNFFIPDNLLKRIENNLETLLKKKREIAIWGINHQVVDLFRRSDLLRNKHIFPIDISSLKRKMDLYGKKVYAPTILNDRKITTVVIAIPAYVTEINMHIEKEHQHVENIFDICELIAPTLITDASFGLEA